jgi:FtsZ-binding cell division protein ZapB
MLITETNLPTPGDRAPPDPAGAAPTAAEDTAALVAAVRDYVRPSLRDSGFPLAEAFARETRQREAEAADARNRTIATLASIRKDSAQLYSDLNAARAELAECRTGWGELRAAVLPLIRSDLADAAKGWTLPALLAEEMRLRAAERDSLARELSEARDSLDALDQANQGLRIEHDAAREALEMCDKERADLVDAVGAHIRPSLKSRHPGTTLAGLLSLEMQERDAANADLRREAQDALSHLGASLNQSTENLEKTTRLLEEGTAEAERLHTGRQRALADLSEARADADALRSERDLLRDNHATASARIAALEASLADYERSNRALQQGLDAERVVMAEMQAATQRLEHAIVHQAISLYEADASARAFARGVAMRRAAAQG